MVERKKVKIYYAQRIKEDEEGYTEGFETFQPPETRYINLRSMSGEAILLSSGEIKQQRIAGKEKVKTYEEHARCYIGVEPTDPGEEALGANYVIVHVSPVGRIKEIIFERMV